MVGSGRQRILIDTGDGREDYLSLLDSVLKDEDIAIYKILITHWHPDHSGGLSSILQRYPQSSIQVFKKAYLAQDEEYYCHLTDIEFKNCEAKPISAEGATIIPILTPGHTSDHLSFYLVEEGVLFSGDCILGEGSTIFEDLSIYMATLERLLAMFPPIKKIYPGHGPVVVDGKSKIIQYIQHRQEREDSIIAILKSEPPPEIKTPRFYDNRPAYSSTDLAEVIYKEHPDGVLRRARHLITLHLKKLLAESRVRTVTLSGTDTKEAYWQWRF